MDSEQCNGWVITYNPDDDRLYVEYPDGIAGATFQANGRGRDNARYWARRHDVNVYQPLKYVKQPK